MTNVLIATNEPVLARGFEAVLKGNGLEVADICFDVGLQSVGSFTTSFTRTYGVSPMRYRAAFPKAADYARIPTCMLRAFGRPRNRTFREDNRCAHL